MTMDKNLVSLSCIRASNFCFSPISIWLADQHRSFFKLNFSFEKQDETEPELALNDP